MPQTLFTNAHLVLDGFAELQRGFNVLVSDGRIAAVSTGPIAAADATVIDAGGRTLMPGLIDAHAHITGLSLTPKNITNPAADIAIASATPPSARPAAPITPRRGCWRKARSSGRGSTTPAGR
jgi:imidazolonepropionase-like amidohydrolase